MGIRDVLSLGGLIALKGEQKVADCDAAGETMYAYCVHQYESGTRRGHMAPWRLATSEISSLGSLKHDLLLM